jgi:hypothetical protein
MNILFGNGNSIKVAMHLFMPADVSFHSLTLPFASHLFSSHDLQVVAPF